MRVERRRGVCRVKQCRALFPKRPTRLCHKCGRPACKYHMRGWSADKSTCTVCVIENGGKVR